ncbi:MAG: hypothetical protein LUQ11_12780 [Methylococcaceae bacterium]|nr:hypothetical protein [Methylococcaceae bacterium]
MVAFLRHFLIVLAVLLQSAAPLVHAHIGGEVSLRGMHLHEFETLHMAAHGMSIEKSVGHSIDAESCIVDLGSAIKQQKTTDDSAPFFYLFNNAPGITDSRDAKIVNFSPHTPGFVYEPFPSDNTSRAPPYSKGA